MRVKLITNPFTAPHLRASAGTDFNIKEVRAIVIHWTANTAKGADADAHFRYFNNGSPDHRGRPRAASAHYVADENGPLQVLPQNRVGFHCGDRSFIRGGKAQYTETGKQIMKGYKTPNYTTIGIEMCVDAGSDFASTELHTVKLAANLLHVYTDSKPSLLRHFDITGKQCPQMYLRQADWDKFRQKVDIEFTRLFLLQSFEVITPELNVRSGPGTNHPVLYKMQRGERGVIETVSPDWVQIREGEFINKRVVNVFS